jgi:TrpR-related protein YerC/YecD
MEKLHNEQVDELFEAILALENIEECYRFFEDACTVKEILEIAQRLKTAKMLSEGANYVEINRETGCSTATISRVRRCMEYGSGGYKTVLERIARKAENR